MRWNYLVLIDEHVFPITKILNPCESAQAFSMSHNSIQLSVDLFPLI